MRILQLCNKSPYPPKEGGSMAMNAVSDMLIHEGCELKILAVNSPKYFTKPESVPENYIAKTGIEWCFIDTGIKPVEALISLLKNESYHVKRFISKNFKKKLIEILENSHFDIIHIETIYLAAYIPVIKKYSEAKIFIRAHNIEHKIWERVASNTENPLKRFYLNILSRQLKKFEMKILEKSDGIITISKIDAEYFKKNGIIKPLCTIPYTIDVHSVPRKIENPKMKNLFSIASMNWQPNIEGISWFLKHCWTMIHNKYPELRLVIAGRNKPDDFLAIPPKGVDVVGEVPDSSIFMKENGILVVPLLSGSGIRIKIVEGMSLGKVIITTSIGAEGIDVTHRENILIANTPSEFLDAVTFCMNNPEKCADISLSALNFIIKKFDREKCAKKLLNFYNTVKNNN